MQVVAEALANLIILCITRKPAAIPKILKHLHGFICTRLEATPADGAASAGPSRSSSAPSSSSTSPNCIAERGAEAALLQLAKQLSAGLPESVPQLWATMTEPVALCASAAATAPVAADVVREAAAALRLVHVMAPALHRSLHEKLAAMVPQMVLCHIHATPALERSVSSALVHLVLAMPDVHLDPIVTSMLPCLEVRGISYSSAGIDRPFGLPVVMSGTFAILRAIDDFHCCRGAQ